MNLQKIACRTLAACLLFSVSACETTSPTSSRSSSSPQPIGMRFDVIWPTSGSIPDAVQSILRQAEQAASQAGIESITFFGRGNAGAPEESQAAYGRMMAAKERAAALVLQARSAGYKANIKQSSLPEIGTPEYYFKD